MHILLLDFTVCNWLILSLCEEIWSLCCIMTDSVMSWYKDENAHAVFVQFSVNVFKFQESNRTPHHILLIYIYIYIYMCVCVCVWFMYLYQLLSCYSHFITCMFSIFYTLTFLFDYYLRFRFRPFSISLLLLFSILASYSLIQGKIRN